MIKFLKTVIKSYSNFHKPSGRKNIFIITMPRSGSTWLMELIAIQAKTKYINEPFYLENKLVKRYLGLSSWYDLHDPSNEKIIENYLKRFIEGKLGFMNPNPIKKFYSTFSDRIVFKIIHCCEEKVGWLEEKFNGQIIYLIRHPIAVSISHVDFPRLDAMVNGSFSRFFTKEQISFAKKILNNGSHNQKGVVSWCLQNAITLSNFKKDWLLLSYEQTVIQPELVLRCISNNVEDFELEQSLKRINKPSGVISLSDKGTFNLVSEENERHKLVSKWRNVVEPKEEFELMDILKVFNLDTYQFGEDHPRQKYLIKGD